MILIGAQTLAVLTVDDTLELFRAKANADGRHLTLISGGKRSQLALTPGDGGLVLQGSLHERAIRASLRRVDSARLLLTSRGFHWVRQQPLNR